MAGGAFDEALAARADGDLSAAEDGSGYSGVRVEEEVGRELAEEEKGANRRIAELNDEWRFAQQVFKMIVASLQIRTVESCGCAPGQKRFLEVGALSLRMRQVESYRLFAVGFAGVSVAAMTSESAP